MQTDEAIKVQCTRSCAGCRQAFLGWHSWQLATLLPLCPGVSDNHVEYTALKYSVPLEALAVAEKWRDLPAKPVGGKRSLLAEVSRDAALRECLNLGTSDANSYGGSLGYRVLGWKKWWQCVLSGIAGVSVSWVLGCQN